MAVSLEEAKKSIGLTSPNFGAPPVVETAIGFRFASIEGFNVVHFGQLLDAYQEHYPNVQLKPPLGGAQIQFRVGSINEDFNPAVRCWYMSADSTQLVQIQNDVFIRNWRPTPDRPEYQHYDAIRPLFARDWLIFLGFLG